jgi:hypothetical protein
VNRIEKKIVLIDGEQLAQLMIDFVVGVTEAGVYSVKKLAVGQKGVSRFSSGKLSIRQRRSRDSDYASRTTIERFRNLPAIIGACPTPLTYLASSA